MTRIDRRNATFQQWQTLLTNRSKRTRAGTFLVQGVRPITLALQHGWTIVEWLTTAERSTWASDLIADHPAPTYALAPELLAELAEKDDGGADLLAVVAQPADDLARIPTGDDRLTIVFDRPTSPGNVGAIVRSLDALGGAGLVVTGHAADPYDAKAVRASTGSLFAVPVVRAPSHREVLAWVDARRDTGEQVIVRGTDEGGDEVLHEAELAAGGVVVIGNETRGMSSGWRDACDRILTIPMGGSASSLNASTAATVVLYEAQRQRLAR